MGTARETAMTRVAMLSSGRRLRALPDEPGDGYVREHRDAEIAAEELADPRDELHVQRGVQPESLPDSLHVLRGGQVAGDQGGRITGREVE